MNLPKQKFCVFCGEPPEGKTLEHVLPKWLIEFTGDPKREWTFGSYLIDHTLKPPKQFSLKEFAFPACHRCNQNMSTLEGRVKNIFEAKLQPRKHLEADEITDLLDWLDKIRIGLWLAGIQLHQNPQGIIPKFHINTRIGIKDRLLLIYPYNTEALGMNLFCESTPIFAYKPSCFAIKINGNFLISLSDDFLVSRFLGMPYPSKIEFEDTGNYAIEAMEVKRKTVTPRFKFLNFAKPSVFIAQTAVRKNIFDEFAHHYKTAFGYGDIAFDESRLLGSPYDCLQSKFITKHDALPYGEILLAEAKPFYELALQAFDLQIHDFSKSPFNTMENEYKKQAIKTTKKIRNLYKMAFKSGKLSFS